MQSAGAREALAKAIWGSPLGVEREDKSVGGCGRRAQGKAGAGEVRAAELDSTKRGRCGRLPAQALVEHERGHRCWGVSPVDHGFGHPVPQRGAACAGQCGWGGGLAQMLQDRVHGRGLGE
jgi:hypothetical protein